MSTKRKAYSVAEKLAVVDRLKNGESQAQVSRSLGVAESTMRGWIKDESRLRKFSSEMEDAGNSRKRQRLAADTTLDKAVMTWFTQKRAEGIPISGPIIAEQAKKMNKMLHPDDESFQGSNGWLHCFKKRHGIAQATIRGEVR